MKNKDNIIIYVGKAKKLKNRLSSYFHGTHYGKTQKLVSEIVDFEYIVVGSETESLILEQNLIKKYNLQNIDVLKVGHHGSKTSSGKDFIDEINPKYSIISVGKNNRYGHPNKEVLNSLENTKIYRTDEDGSIIFKIKNEQLKIETCSP